MKSSNYFFSFDAEREIETERAKFNYFQIILLAESSIFAVQTESSSQVDKEGCAITVSICFSPGEKLSLVRNCLQITQTKSIMYLSVGFMQISPDCAN